MLASDFTRCRHLTTKSSLPCPIPVISGVANGVANEQRPNGASWIDVPEQQGEEARHGREERREVREGAEGNKTRVRRGIDSYTAAVFGK